MRERARERPASASVVGAADTMSVGDTDGTWRRGEPRGEVRGCAQSPYGGVLSRMHPRGAPMSARSYDPGCTRSCGRYRLSPLACTVLAKTRRESYASSVCTHVFVCWCGVCVDTHPECRCSPPRSLVSVAKPVSVIAILGDVRRRSSSLARVRGERVRYTMAGWLFDDSS